MEEEKRYNWDNTTEETERTGIANDESCGGETGTIINNGTDNNSEDGTERIHLPNIKPEGKNGIDNNNHTGYLSEEPCNNNNKINNNTDENCIHSNEGKTENSESFTSNISINEKENHSELQNIQNNIDHCLNDEVFKKNANSGDDNSYKNNESSNCNKIPDGEKEEGSTLSNDSMDTDDEEILKNTIFTDEDKFKKRPSRSRRSGVVNDSTFIERMLSTSSTNSTEDLTSIDLNDTQNDDPIESEGQNGDNNPLTHASFFIGSKTKTNEVDDEAESQKEPEVNNENPSSPSPTDDSMDIYYEEGPKRLKRSALSKEDFSGAKTYQNKNKLIVKYPNRKVSFEHSLVLAGEEEKIDPLTVDVGTASPKTILKSPKRRASFESHMYRHIQPTGHINYAYLHDEFRDKLEKRKVSLETAHYYEQESEIYNGREFDNDMNIRSARSGVESGEFVNRQNSSDSHQNGTCRRSESTESFTCDNERYLSKRANLLFDNDEYDLINKNFSAHLRKDSIALTSEKLRQLESIQRHYNPCTFVEEPVRKIWKEKLARLNKYQLHICVICIFLALVLIVVVGWHFHNRTNKMETLGKRIFFDPETKEIYLPSPGDTHRLHGTIGLNVPNWQLPFHCHTEAEKATYTCLRWKDNAILRISYFEVPDVHCYNISWEQLRHDLIPFDCFNIGEEQYWYGPSNQSSPTWPLTSEPFIFSASMSRHFDAGTFSSAIDYHWISSAGAAIFVPNEVPLEFDWNIRTGQMCLIAKYAGDFYGGHTIDNARLNYTVCNGKDTVTTYKYTRTLDGKFPKSLPSAVMLHKPVWSSSVDRVDKANEQKLMEMLDKIKMNKLPCSIFEIAGQWQNRLGDLSFDNNTISNVSRISDLAAENECLLSIEINPYFDVSTQNGEEGIKREYFIKDSGSFAPGVLQKFSNKITAMLDVTKPAANMWMKQKLIDLKQKTNIQSFSVVYAEPFWVPYNPSFYEKDINPSTLREMYTRMFSATTSKQSSNIFQGTSNTQDISHFLPVESTVTTKKEKICLTGAIERTLALGIKGYPFVISDLLPQKDTDGKQLLSRELYIRWLQLSAFLPAMRYNVMPWDYDKHVVEIAQNITYLHRLYTVSIISSLKNEILAGEPIIRPVWWAHPNDKEAFKVSDEFLVGNDMLVAPVLCENMKERQIYFPEGMWSDKANGNLIQGKSWIKYEVKENRIPYFLRVKVLTTNGGI